MFLLFLQLCCSFLRYAGVIARDLGFTTSDGVARRFLLQVATGAVYLSFLDADLFAAGSRVAGVLAAVSARLVPGALLLARQHVLSSLAVLRALEVDLGDGAVARHALQHGARRARARVTRASRTLVGAFCGTELSAFFIARLAAGWNIWVVRIRVAQMAELSTLVVSAGQRLPARPSAGAPHRRVARLAVGLMLAEAEHGDRCVAGRTFQGHYLSFRWLYIPGSRRFLDLLEDYSFVFMTNGFALMTALWECFVADRFARRTVSKMTGMHIFLKMSTLVLYITLEVAFWWLCEALSPAWDCDVGFLALAGYFG